MKTIEEMRQTIVEVLEAEGFKQTGRNMSYSDGSWYSSGYAKDGDLVRTPVPGYSFKRLNGKEIGLSVVYRSNGTTENRSIRICVTEWVENMGHSKTWKLYGRDGERKTARILAEVLEAYENA